MSSITFYSPAWWNKLPRLMDCDLCRNPLPHNVNLVTGHVSDGEPHWYHFECANSHFHRQMAKKIEPTCFKCNRNISLIEREKIPTQHELLKAEIDKVTSALDQYQKLVSELPIGGKEELEIAKSPYTQLNNQINFLLNLRNLTEENESNLKTLKTKLENSFQTIFSTRQQHLDDILKEFNETVEQFSTTNQGLPRAKYLYQMAIQLIASDLDQPNLTEDNRNHYLFLQGQFNTIRTVLEIDEVMMVLD